MERLNLSKEEIISCLKDFLEEFYDLEFDDVILNNDEKKRSVLLSYYIIYHGMRQKVFLPLEIGNFTQLLKYAVERKKGFFGTNVVVLPGEELKCRVNYRLTNNDYGRRRKR